MLAGKQAFRKGADMQTGRQTDRLKGRQVGRRADIWEGKLIGRHKG